jgi:hypothetical protein
MPGTPSRWCPSLQVGCRPAPLTMDALQRVRTRRSRVVVATPCLCVTGCLCACRARHFAPAPCAFCARGAPLPVCGAGPRVVRVTVVQVAGVACRWTPLGRPARALRPATTRRPEPHPPRRCAISLCARSEGGGVKNVGAACSLQRRRRSRDAECLPSRARRNQASGRPFPASSAYPLPSLHPPPLPHFARRWRWGPRRVPGFADCVTRSWYPSGKSP